VIESKRQEFIFRQQIAVHSLTVPRARLGGTDRADWLLIARFDFPAYLALIPFGSRILALPHVDWIEHLTGEWITGEWEPFIAPLLAFAILGTAWWLLLGWLAGRLWMLIRPHV